MSADSNTSQILDKNTLITRKTIESIKTFRNSVHSTGNGSENTMHISFHYENNAPITAEIPLSLLNILEEALLAIANGKEVQLLSSEKELTTQEAADFLMVSRPYLIAELLESHKIPYRKVGNRRRIRLKDLITFQSEEQKEIERRTKVMEEFVKETKDLGIYE